MCGHGTRRPSSCSSPQDGARRTLERLARRAGCCLVAVWAVSAPAFGAGTTQAVRVWGDWVAPGPGMTHAQTRRAALDSARARAVEQVAGVRLDAGSVYESGLERVHFLQALTRGHVVGEEVLEWQQKNFAGSPTEPPLVGYRVRLEAEVVVPPAPADPGFSVEARLNRTAFEAGDEAVIGVEAKRTAWVYVFNLTADDRPSLLFPNRWQPDNRLAPAQGAAFPAEGSGVRLEMQPLPDEPESAEAFLVVAFPEPVSIAERIEAGRSYRWTEFYRRLSAFPLERAAMRMLPYTVRAKGGER